MTAKHHNNKRFRKGLLQFYSQCGKLKHAESGHHFSQFWPFGAWHSIMLSLKYSIITITYFSWWISKTEQRCKIKSIAQHKNSYLIESQALNPSRGLVPSRFPPAMPATMVGSQSLTCMRSRLIVPFTVSGRRGLWMNPVTRIPPSHSVVLLPLSGQLLPPVSVAPPLSGRKNNIVAFIMTCADYIHRRATIRCTSHDVTSPRAHGAHISRIRSHTRN